MSMYGKLPPGVLQRLLAAVEQRDSRVVIGPAVGEDAAVIDMGDRYLVAKSDPITFAAERIGWYAVQVNANDVAALGARPRWFLATILLPRADAALAEAVLRDIGDACAGLGITLCGGHTEVTPGLDRPIVCGHLLGEVAKDRLVRKQSMRAGDVLLLTRGVAIEGTAIIGREMADKLAATLDVETIRRAGRLLIEPGISVVEDALCAAGAAEVHAMHDPTEGGLIGGLYELAVAAGASIEIESARVPVLEETRAICGALNLDPLRLIASGTLLIAAAPPAAEAALAALARRGTRAAVIGRVVASGPPLTIDGRPASFPERDEISRLFD